MVDTLDRNWLDISSEAYRQYFFSGRDTYMINKPVKLLVSDSGGHRVFDEAGQCHYISPRWLAILWVAKANAPDFVA